MEHSAGAGKYLLMKQVLISVLRKWCGVKLQRRPRREGIRAAVAAGGGTRRRRRRGYIGMYVGKEAQRYEVPVKWLAKPSVQELVTAAGAPLDSPKIVGPLSIPCSVESFDRLLFVEVPGRRSGDHHKRGP